MGKHSGDRTLPVYRLAQESLDEADLARIARSVFGWERHATARVGGRLVLRSGTEVVDSHAASASVWAADEACLWNPHARPRLASLAKAQAVADRLVADLEGAGFGFASVKGQPVRRRQRGAAFGTRIARRRAAGGRTRWADLDVVVRYDYEVVLPEGTRGTREPIPVVGGGGKLRVTLGEGGRVIGLSGTWRRIVGVAGTATPCPAKRAVEEHLAAIRATRERGEGVRCEAYLAYYGAPPSARQDLLVPVWAVRALEETCPPGLCPRTAFVPVDRAWEFARPLRPLLLRDPWPWCGATRRTYSVVATWIGLGSRGSLTARNAEGFLATAQADGATPAIAYAEPEARRRLWLEGSLSGVDAADLVFHTGHADANGWSVTPDVANGDDYVGCHHTGQHPTGNRWGSGQMDWLVVAGCGPLQDAKFGTSGDAIARWTGGGNPALGAFQGLRGLLGYASTSADTADEGHLLVTYAAEGWTLTAAWFRAATETQPSALGATKPWAAGLHAVWPGGEAIDDHLWGHGSVAPASGSPTEYVLFGTPT